MGAVKSNEPLGVALLGLDAVGEYIMYLSQFQSWDQAVALWSNLSPCVFIMINNASCHTFMYKEAK